MLLAFDIRKKNASCIDLRCVGKLRLLLLFVSAFQFVSFLFPSVALLCGVNFLLDFLHVCVCVTSYLLALHALGTWANTLFSLPRPRQTLVRKGVLLTHSFWLFALVTVTQTSQVAVVVDDVIVINSFSKATPIRRHADGILGGGILSQDWVSFKRNASHLHDRWGPLYPNMDNPNSRII